MGDSQEQSVLWRKVQAGRSGTAITPMSPAKALRIAIPKAGMSANGLQLAVSDLTGENLALTPLLDALPTRGLFLRLDGPGASNGFAVLDAGLLTSIIEMQTMGRVGSGEVPDRMPTTTDAIISEDIVNDCLATFATALTGLPDWDWARGYKVAGKVDGARALGLLLEDVAFRRYEIEIDVAGAARKGKLTLALPAQGRGAGGAKTGKADKDWSSALVSSISQAQASLNVVLHRHILPLSQVETLRVGEVLTLPMEAMGEVRLEAEDGDCAAIGRLGQIRGMRAIKLSGTGEGAEAAPEALGGSGSGPLTIAASSGPADPLAEAPAQNAVQGDPGALPDAPGLEPAGLPEMPELPDLPELPELPELPQTGELPELPQLP